LTTFASSLLNSPATAQTAPPQSFGQDIARIGRTPEGHAAVSIHVPSSQSGIGPIDAIFDFGENAGFLGPSSDPARQQAFTNADATLIAVNHQPAAKSSYVYLFLRSVDGDLTISGPINTRVAQLLRGSWGEAAKSFLRVESISGRHVQLQILSFAHAPADRYDFTIDVRPDGPLALVK
jgi:hypothetical protein